MNESVISVRNLRFAYEDKLVMDKVNFDINKGDFVGIIGPNGSGKSTLLKLMLKILEPQGGEIALLNQSIRQFTDWAHIGYVSQKANAFNGSFPATVEEVVGSNLYSQIGPFRFPKREHKLQVYEALKKVGMEAYKDRLIGNLSGGQQQRVFIARK